jgi:hypothetical protein
MDRAPLAARRKRETEAVAETLGIDYEVFDAADGFLEATPETRRRVIRFVRRVDPDLVHRYCAQLLQDAASMLRVPNVCPDTLPLLADPVFGYVPDRFRKPASFEPDVVVESARTGDISLV